MIGISLCTHDSGTVLEHFGPSWSFSSLFLFPLFGTRSQFTTRCNYYKMMKNVPWTGFHGVLFVSKGPEERLVLDIADWTWSIGTIGNLISGIEFLVSLSLSLSFFPFFEQFTVYRFTISSLAVHESRREIIKESQQTLFINANSIIYCFWKEEKEKKKLYRRGRQIRALRDHKLDKLIEVHQEGMGTHSSRIAFERNTPRSLFLFPSLMDHALT